MASPKTSRIQESPLASAQDAPQTRQDTPELIPGIPDDIADPALPATLVEAIQASGKPDPAWAQHEVLLQGALQALMGKIQPELFSYMKHAEQGVDDVMQWCRAYMETEKAKVEQAKYLCDQLLTKITTEGLQLRHDPYSVDIKAMSPQGFVVAFSVKQSNAEDLVGETMKILGWLAEKQFSAIEAGMPL